MQFAKKFNIYTKIVVLTPTQQFNPNLPHSFILQYWRIGLKNDLPIAKAITFGWSYLHWGTIVLIILLMPVAQVV